MPLLTLSEVPAYLKTSVRYKNLSQCGTASVAKINVPARCLKRNTTVKTVEDMKLLMSTLDYWCLDTLPPELVQFCITNTSDRKTFIKAMSEASYCLPQLCLFTYVFSHERPLWTMRAIKVGSLQILRALLQEGTAISDACKFAAFCGNVSCLECAHVHGAKWNASECAKLSAQEGHIECLKYAHAHGCVIGESTEIMNKAAENGHLECVKYMHENGCPWDDFTCRFAAVRGHINCLRYAHKNGCPCDKDLLKLADLSGNEECVLFVRTHCCAPEDDD